MEVIYIVNKFLKIIDLEFFYFRLIYYIYTIKLILMKTITIFTVIPYYDNGVDIFLNDVKSFTSHDEAVKYAQTHHNGYYDITESELEINL